MVLSIAGYPIACGVITWYNFPVPLVNTTSKLAAGTESFTVINFTDEFLVTDSTTVERPTSKTLFVIVIAN
jgi:hypothetical protein